MRDRVCDRLRARANSFSDCFPPGVAAEALLEHLTHGRAIDAAALRKAMTAAFGGSDAEGAWDWKSAYDASEAATVLFLRKFAPGMRARAATPAALLGMLAKLATLLPSQTHRSEESQSFQQFSTPIGYGFVASTAAAITAADLVLEPSAGTGLLAIFAELASAGLALNELAGARADLLAWLFSDIPLARHDAAHIDDHLDADVRPTVVLMNPPFSAAAHVEGRVADAALRHVTSALVRLADGGRLVAITGASLSPDNPAWRDAFVRLQERVRIVFSAAVSGSVYARRGTTIDTRLTVIDRVPAEELRFLPGVARDGGQSCDAARLGDPARAPMAGYRVDTRAYIPGRAICAPCRDGAVFRQRRPLSSQLTSSSSLMSRSTGGPRRAAGSAMPSTSHTPFNRSAFRRVSRTPPGSFNRRPWRPSRRRNRATVHISRPMLCPMAFYLTPSSRA